MNITGLGPRERREIEEALRRGEPLGLQLDGELPRALRAEQVAPWFDAASARSPSLQDALRSYLPPAARPEAPPIRVSAVIPTNRGTPWASPPCAPKTCRWRWSCSRTAAAAAS